MVLDLYEFCTEAYKAQLEGPRKAWQAAEDARAGLERAAKKAKAEVCCPPPLPGSMHAPAHTPAPQQADRRLVVNAQQESAAPSKAEKGANGKAEEAAAGEASSPDAEVKGAGEDASAAAEARQYAGQVTGACPQQEAHAWRALGSGPCRRSFEMLLLLGNAGRYELVAVLTHKGRSADSGHYVGWTRQEDGQWVQFDDEDMIPRKQDEVLALSGGGDWHMAYLLLYRALCA